MSLLKCKGDEKKEKIPDLLIAMRNTRARAFEFSLNENWNFTQCNLRLFRTLMWLVSHATRYRGCNVKSACELTRQVYHPSRYIRAINPAREWGTGVRGGGDIDARISEVRKLAIGRVRDMPHTCNNAEDQVAGAHNPSYVSAQPAASCTRQISHDF